MSSTAYRFVLIFVIAIEGLNCYTSQLLKSLASTIFVPLNGTPVYFSSSSYTF